MIHHMWAHAANFTLALGLCGVVVALLGPWLVPFARRRRRCPRCWYDLSRTAGMGCSECGFTATRERQLHRSRRLWSPAAVGVALLLASHALRVTPAVRTHGWPAAVPLTVKIGLMPWLNPDYAALRPYLRSSRSAGAELDWRDRVYVDLVRGCSDIEAFGWWHERWFRLVTDEGDSDTSGRRIAWPRQSDRVMAATIWRGGAKVRWPDQSGPDSPSARIVTRPRWLSGQPIYLMIVADRPPAGTSQYADLQFVRSTNGSFAKRRQTMIRSSNHQMERTHLIEVPMDADETSLLSASISLQHEQLGRLQGMPAGIRRTVHHPRQRVDLHIQFVNDVHEIIQPAPSVLIEHELKKAVQPSLAIEPAQGGARHLELLLDLNLEPSPTLMALLQSVTFAARLEVRVDGRLVGEGAFCTCNLGDAGTVGLTMNSRGIPIRMVVEPQNIQQGWQGDWQLRLIGDPILALRDLQATHYWSGTINVPLTLD